MTVDEVLRALGAAFPAFNAKALEAWAPVFRATLDRHEGIPLRDAHLAVMTGFKPSGRMTFPVPGEYASHLPSGKLHLPSNEPALDRAGHKRRKDALVAAWLAEQGAKIKTARGPFVWSHSLWAVQAIAQTRAWSDRPEPIVLSREVIQRCEDQAVSTARMQAHGASVLRRGDGALWQTQTDACRDLVRAGRWPKPMSEPGEASSSIRPSEAMKKRLAEMGNGWRAKKLAERMQEATV